MITVYGSNDGKSWVRLKGKLKSKVTGFMQIDNNAYHYLIICNAIKPKKGK